MGQPGSTSGPVSALGLEGGVGWVCLASDTGLNPKPPKSFFPEMQWAGSDIVVGEVVGIVAYSGLYSGLCGDIVVAYSGWVMDWALSGLAGDTGV